MMKRMARNHLLGSAAVLLLAAACARGDEASTALAKYTQPVAGAIDRALAYLAKQQKADGSFPATSGTGTAVASLGAMAFLAKGNTPGAGPYGQAINGAVDYVVRNQHSSGLLCESAQARGAMYSHSISTLMLSEVSGMVDPARQKRLDPALGKALRLILAAQQVPKAASHQGGWRYQQTSTDSDISCTGWAVMSLRSARNSGAAVPKEAIDQAIGFILRCRTSDGGFAYQPGGGVGMARTGTALLCLELCGQHRSEQAVQAGDRILEYFGQARTVSTAQEARIDEQAQRSMKAMDASIARLKAAGGANDARAAQLQQRREQLLRKNKEAAERAVLARQRTTRLRFGGSYFYYGMYYCAQGMFQLGGAHWEQYAAQLYDMMLKYQRPDGSWPEATSRAGPCYSAAMGVLTLSVSYRQLPIYQR